MTAGGGAENERILRETDRISSQHAQINIVYADLLRALDKGAHHNAFVCFVRWRDVLHAHFEVEDRIYFPTVRNFRPDRKEVLEQLEREHAEFRSALDRIERYVSINAIEETREHLAAFVDVLLRHEGVEEALLLEMTQGRP